MKIIPLVLSFLSLSAEAADRPSTHGMLLFGQQKVYVSHLPMFHSPHDYQLIAEVELPPEARAIYESNLRQHPVETVYTLVPEVFVLPEMVANPRPFRADLVRGHFERGGTEIATQLTVKLGRVVHFRKFDPKEQKPALATYLLFGNAEEAFLAHYVAAKPDFDHVLALRGGFTGEPTLLETGATNSRPLAEGTFTFKSRGDGQGFTLNLKKSLYFETGDLAH
jgi:hypothetical protein